MNKNEHIKVPVKNAYSLKYLLFITGSILDPLGNVKVENSSSSIIRLPDANTTKILVCTKDEVVKMLSVNIVTIIRNCDTIKTRKHNAPNSKIFERILKSILQVMARVGKKIKNSNWVYTGGIIWFLISPIEKRP